MVKKKLLKKEISSENALTLTSSLCYAKRGRVGVDRERHWSPVVDSNSFPVRLEPGQQYSEHFPITALLNTFLSQPNQNSTLKVFATDTINKKYYSKKTKVSMLISNLKVAQTFKP